jgi:hypothetical protein
MQRDTKLNRQQRDQLLRDAAAQALGCLMAHYSEPPLPTHPSRPARSVQAPADHAPNTSHFIGELHHVG